ncbi:MAG: DUF1329 domain-containing protein [bacterium]|nr:DUF1329 domain-containing protein [bacterium]
MRITYCLFLAYFVAFTAKAVELPPEGACPPHTLSNSSQEDSLPEDAVPSRIHPGQILDLEKLAPLSDFLPPEVWERRQSFFFEGQMMQIGPCYRRYPVAPYFEAATAEHAGKATLNEDFDLIDYSGTGLPFPIESIPDEAADAALKWAWNFRYRYQGAGFRGRFRLRDVMNRGHKVERFEGRFFFLPLHGYPGVESRDERNRFVAGGQFTKPTISRGLSWRQFRRASVDQDYSETDDVFVYIPSSRKVRRAPPQNAEGVYLPSYTRANTIDASSVTLPDGTNISDVTLTAAEPVRKGFVGLMIRPNAYRFEALGVKDVLAPINTNNPGYPTVDERSYGPSGLSVASDRWELRRAVVLSGVRKVREGNIARITLYADAQTLAPLYLIARRSNGSIAEVGIFVGRYSSEDPMATEWQGNQANYGLILSVAETFLVSGSGGWVRESFELKAHPPSSEEASRFQTTRRLQLKGR